MAPNAALRPFQMAALCSALWLMRIALGANGLAISVMTDEQVGDLLVRPLHLDDQHRLDLERVAGLGEGLADVDRRPVHELDGDGDDAGADDGGNALAGGLAGVEAEQHGTCAFGRAQDAHGRLGGDAELALGADRQTQQIVARANRGARRRSRSPRRPSAPSSGRARCWWSRRISGNARRRSSCRCCRPACRRAGSRDRERRRSLAP